MFKLYCGHCQPVAVNGTPTHERGCPNAGERWVFRRKRHLGVALEQPVCIPETEPVPAWLRQEEPMPAHEYEDGGRGQ